MTINIKAPRAYYDPVTEDCYVAIKGGTHRIVRESDWKRLMKLVRCVEDFNENSDRTWDEIEAALDALRGKK